MIAANAGLRTTGPLTWLPVLLACGLLAFLATGRVQGNEHMLYAFAGVGGGLLVWYFALRATGRMRGVEPIPPVRQHFIQAMVQVVLYVWWGYHWTVGQGDDVQRPIFLQAPMIVAQFCYLYAFDGLWSWTRGRPWRLASGPAPIVLSTNLFIWFKDDWFVWQFAMITAGLLGKEFIRWTKEGRRTHVFNPSGFGLMCAATVLIVTGTTDITWAKPLATTIEVEQIFVVLFVLGLVVQAFFAVTLMTFAAALVMIAGNLLYTAVTDVYLFGSSNLPAAAFLGLMLLMTDPSTSPRSNVGRVIFGAGYGLGYVVFFELLGKIGAPELYAKLYPVPILNCTVQALDRFARRGAIGRLNERWETGVSPKVSNAVHMALWSAVFVVMVVTEYVPVGRGTSHPGLSLSFWKRAVAEHKHDAERKLIYVAGARALTEQDREAFNELGILSLTSELIDSTQQEREVSAAEWFFEAARRGSVHGQLNMLAHFLFNGNHSKDADGTDATLTRAFVTCDRLIRKAADPRATFLMAVAMELGRGQPPNLREALALYRRCPPDYVYAQKGIARLGLQRGALIDLKPVVPVLTAAAAGGDAEAMYYLAYMNLTGRGVAEDERAAEELLSRAVGLGYGPAIEAAKTEQMPAFRAPPRRDIAFPPWSTAFPVTAD